jgi:hypothetical protein
MHRKIVAFSGALLLNCINQENDPHLQQRREDLVRLYAFVEVILSKIDRHWLLLDYE